MIEFEVGQPTGVAHRGKAMAATTLGIRQASFGISINKDSLCHRTAKLDLPPLQCKVDSQTTYGISLLWKTLCSIRYPILLH